ncbi:MAG: ACT domain-containing protein, partial [Peptococcaceae bacterium]|nr:ACT domain-containing protein [Peptococcaceae bacterium]
GHLVLVPHKDQPKVVGPVGMILGEKDVNIAGMQLGRRELGGDSLMVLIVDNEVSASVLEELKKVPAVFKAAYLYFG